VFWGSLKKEPKGVLVGRLQCDSSCTRHGWTCRYECQFSVGFKYELYGIRMSGDGAILAVGMMACFFSAVMSAGLSYTCTGGSFDPDDFDTKKCLDLFPEDTSGGGGGGGTTNPATNPTAPGTETCTYLYEDKLTTCYDVNSGEAGVRWEWLDSDEAEACKAGVTKYGIVISSSQYNHNVKYKFPDIIGRDSNAFKFNGAPGGFLGGQNIKFEITPMNDRDEKIGNTVTATLDTNNSSETCNAHGNAVPFSKATSLGAVGLKPNLTPTPCQGNTYTPPSACMRGDVVLDGTPSKCGQGMINWALDTSAADYVAAKDGGACTLAHSRVCEVPCPPDAPPPPACNEYVLGWQENLGLGCVADNFNHSTPPTDENAYTKYTGGYYPVGGSDGVKQFYKLSTDPQNCPKLTEWRACGYTEAPVNCVGQWINNGAEYLKSKQCNGCTCTRAAAYYQPKKYKVTTQANATGAACEAVDGATKEIKTRPCPAMCCRCCH